MTQQFRDKVMPWNDAHSFPNHMIRKKMCVIISTFWFNDCGCAIFQSGIFTWNAGFYAPLVPWYLIVLDRNLMGLFASNSIKDQIPSAPGNSYAYLPSTFSQLFFTGM